MKKIVHISTDVEPNKTCILLEQYKVPYRRSDATGWVSFDVDPAQESFADIWHSLLGLQASHEGKKACRVRYENVYSETDRLSAAYLYVLSTFNCLEPVNDETVMAGSCYLGSWTPSDLGPLFHFDKPIDHYRHWVQAEPFVIKKRVNWRPNRSFGGCQVFLFPLFCNDHAKEIITSAGLRGASFRPVLQHGTGQEMPDLWQLWPQELEDFLEAGPHTEEHVCEICGRRYFTPVRGDAEYQIRADSIPEDLDFFQSWPIIGDEKCMPIYIVSQRAYRVLKAANIIRSLVFRPVEITKPSISASIGGTVNAKTTNPR